ncbi:MAG: SusC/RagA family TonB-linked outer membrane protein [Dysgonomonas sp.]
MTNTIKILLRKRVSMLLLLFCFATVLTAAQSGKLSISLKQATLRSLFSNIESQTDLLFFYVDSDVANIKVDVNAKDKEVAVILDQALSNTNLKYNIEGRNVNIFKQAPQQSSTKKRITGRVSDVNGEPLPGVSVVEAGTTNGTMTDPDGLYELQVGEKNAQVTFTYVGFKTITLNVSSASVYDVSMEEVVNELNEMVVIGYGEQRKISSIGSQSTLKTADIKAPTGSLSTVLAGRLSGVVAVQRTGEPGKDGADIWIRGISTPNGANPLILVDGVERPFNDLDPEDIESVTILKDASATAVYGVRGANGVIIVKTKPGIIGKPTVSIDYYEGFNRFTKAPKLAGGVAFMEAANEASYNMGDGQYNIYSQDYIENTRLGSDRLLYPDVNWRKEIFNDWGHSRRVNANIRGGSPMAQFYASVSYYNELGTIKTNDYESYDSATKFSRYNFTTNVNLKVTESTTVDIGAQGYLGDGNYPGQSSGTIFSSTMEVNPVKYPVMFVVDGVQYVPGTHTQGAERNPYADATKRGYAKEMNNKIQSNIRLTQDLAMLTQGLKATAMFAYDVTTNRRTEYNKRESTYYFADRGNPYDENGNPILTSTWPDGSTTLSFGGNSFNGDRKDYIEAALTYDRAFGDHRAGGMVIYTQQSRTVNNAGSIIDAIPYRMQGVAGRATYSWKDRYFAEFNIGYNGGENFPKDRRFGTFPAFGIGWVASNEAFWEPISKAVSFFKIRYTNGKVGNSNIGNRRFMYIEQYEGSGDYGYTFGENNGRNGIKVKNPATSLGWEEAHKQDIGLDIKLFNNDLSLVIDGFYEKRSKVLLNRNESLPGFAGFQETPVGNVGETKTVGIDGSLEYLKKVNDDLTVTLRGNFTWAKPEWVDNDIPDKKYAWRNRQGFSLTSVEGFTATGLYTQSDIDVINAWLALPAATRENTPQPYPTPYKVGLKDVRAGDIIYEDKNGDGVINDDDISWLGNGDVPEINYGFGFNIDYKALSFGLLFQGTAQANRFVGGITKPFNDSGNGAVYSNIEDRWSEDNPSQNVFYPRLAYGNDALGNQNNFVNSTWWLKDMSFLRLKTLQVSYRLPQAWCRKVYLKNASVYMMGMNLFTLSKWKLWDPELNTDNGTSYPNTTSYTIGINLSF